MLAAADQILQQLHLQCVANRSQELQGSCGHPRSYEPLLLAFELSCEFHRLAVYVQYHLTTCHDLMQPHSHQQLWCARRPTSGTAARAAAIQQQHEISSRTRSTAGMAPLGWVQGPCASSSRRRRVRCRLWRGCRFRRRARRQAQLRRPL